MALESSSLWPSAVVVNSSFLKNRANSCCSLQTLILKMADSNSASQELIQLCFPNKKPLVTTYYNACRLIMKSEKWMSVSNSFSTLTPSNFAAVEKWLNLCILECSHDVFKKKVQQTLDRSSCDSPYLIEKHAITAGDIAVYCKLKAGTTEARNERLEKWMMQMNNILELVKLTDPISNGSPGPNDGKPTNFIRQIIESDIFSQKHSTIVTRFPPEPNGFLHLGHAKSICLNFGLAKEFKGRCHLRFDDTNPTKENLRYIEAIKEDVKWLGCDYGDHVYYTSDCFDQLYLWAVDLIKKGLAYVDDQTEEQVRVNRGDLLTPGVNSPYRNRTVSENLRLFEKLKNGEVEEGKSILRAKIDMTHGNMIMRDPPIYRVRFHPHPRTSNAWCIYPIYDFAHGQTDSIEKITHSLCTLEFEDHRPLYDWFQEKLGIHKTRQIEFARLNCSYTVMSKRKLLALVDNKIVNDWDDPRLPTLAGMRRRGYPPQALWDFCEKIGVAKRDTMIPYESVLHPIALRRHVVLRPLKIKITNLEDDYVEILECPNHPERSDLGTRQIRFTNELYIDREDFKVEPEQKYFRLAPNREVRLHHAYWIRCHDYQCDAEGNVVEVYCTYDPSTRGGKPPGDGRKVKGTLHWVSACDSKPLQVRLYSKLFTTPTPDCLPEGKTIHDYLNPSSLQVMEALGEVCLSHTVHPFCAKDGETSHYFQFERVGFFVPDYDSTPEHPIMNLTVSLTDSWTAQTKKDSQEAQRKALEKAAREKAALERQKKNEQRMLKKKGKEK